jgi:Ser/Thr protein kinase RdoA (MazF antagonist)
MKEYWIPNLLNEYRLGELVSCFKIKRMEQLQNCFILETSKGKFFVKQYKPSRFGTKKGNVNLILFLQKKKYPVVELLQTAKGKPYVLYNKTAFTVWEFFKERRKDRLTLKEGFEFGKALGRLHRLTRYYKLGEGRTYQNLLPIFKESLSFIKTAPASAVSAAEYLKRKLKDLKVSHGQPKAVCHDEYSTEHVRFKNGKLVKVLDWDGASRDYMFYDLAFALSPSASKGRINFKLLKSILRGYESERKLTSWEKGHIFECLLFGAFKWFCWANDREEQEISGWNIQTIRGVETIMKNESRFYERLNS